MLISFLVFIKMSLLSTHIMDSVLSLHELMHNAHVKNQMGIILKIGFEKLTIR
jgi:hypothetical protein